MGKWAAVMTKPNCERSAAERARDQGYALYVPLTLSRRNKVIALFPRYFFALISGHWNSLRHTRGVTSVVGSGESFSEVRASHIQELMDRENEKGLIVDPRFSFARGDAVEIISGLLAGIGVAEYLSKRNGGRAALSLGGATVEVSESDLAHV